MCSQEIDDFENVFASAQPAGIRQHIKLYQDSSNPIHLTLHFKPPILLCYGTNSLVTAGRVYEYP